LEKGVDEIINNSLQRDDKISWMLKKLIKQASQSGASGAAAISASDISVEDDLAKLCREPQCESYGLSTSCPPHVSGPSGFRKLLKKFKHAIVIKIDVPLEILFSSERRDIMKLLHEIAAGIEQAAVKTGYHSSKAFAGGSCKKNLLP
jgi:predicted metal-binding protein